MGIQKLLIRSGVTTEATQTLAEGMWSRSDRIRFRDGMLEKMFGWAKFITAGLTGVCRTLTDWVDFSRLQYLAAGTNSFLYVIVGGNLWDITPIDNTANVAVTVDTTIGSPVATITDAAHGLTTGDYVDIYVPIAVGGLILHGTYAVTVVDANNYTVTASSNATANVTNGGAVPLFNTTNLSTTVTVTLAAHGLTTNDLFVVEVSTTVATIVISGEYIVTVLTANTFTIVGGSAANATTSGSENGGNARYLYLLPPGLESSQPAVGWGSGPWGGGTWGVGGGSGMGVTPLRIWSLGPFGEDLVALPTNGAFYKWSPPAVLGNRATLITGDPPATSLAMFISMPQLQVVALGTEVLSTQDPLLVRWSDIGDYTTWTATATNQAGSFRLSSGGRIVGGLQGSQAGLIWTDEDLWQMQYIGPPFIYSFRVIAMGCGLVSQHAMGVIDKKVFWMGLQGFFVYDGGIQPIPCAVWDTVFQDLDTDNADKIIAASQSSQHEVTWYYPSASGGTGEIDSYVKINTISGDWDYGTLARTAWIDHNVFGEAIGVDLASYLQQHDQGYDDDGAPMEGVMAETGAIDLVDGQDMIFMDQIIPDFKFDGTAPEVNLYVKTWKYPFSTPVEHGPFAVNGTTQFISLRARARQMALRVECDRADTWFRMGAPRVRTAPAGRLP